MFRIGPFGAGALGESAGGAGAGAPRGADLSRVVMLFACTVVVGGLAIGFWSQSRGGAPPDGGARRTAGGDALRSASPDELQIQPVPDPGDPDGDAAVPPFAPPAEPTAPDPKPAKFVEDPAIYDEIEQGGREIEPRALWHLMHKAVVADPMALHREARPVRFRDFAVEPEKLVGKPVQFTGRLFQLDSAGSDKFPADPMQNPSGVTNAVWGYVADPGFKPCHFYAPKLPSGVRTGDTVTLVGYFVKVYTFENAHGNEMRAPLMVARLIVEEVPEAVEPIVWYGIPLVVAGHALTWLQLLAVGAILVSLPLGLWYLRVERRQFAEYRQQSMARRRKRGVGAPTAEGVAVTVTAVTVTAVTATGEASPTSPAAPEPPEPPPAPTP
jgi:hypothetical protein